MSSALFQFLLLRFLHQLGPSCAREYIKLEIVESPNMHNSYISLPLESDHTGKYYFVTGSDDPHMDESTNEKIEVNESFLKKRITLRQTTKTILRVNNGIGESNLKNPIPFFVSSNLPVKHSFEWTKTDDPRLYFTRNPASSESLVFKYPKFKNEISDATVGGLRVTITLRTSDDEHDPDSYNGAIAFFDFKRLWSEIPSTVFENFKSLLPEKIKRSITHQDNEFKCSLREDLSSIAFEIAPEVALEVASENPKYEFTAKECVLEVSDKKDSKSIKRKCYLAINPGRDWIFSSLFAKRYATKINHHPPASFEFVQYERKEPSKIAEKSHPPIRKILRLLEKVASCDQSGDFFMKLAKHKRL
uniref:AlNc14C834G12562 protein n=1 Tax=Albugo laibachii Nc14 TaxID=890382 RepID=F0X252_9STRA|nr:AlNc14C834G12562 [Albugo laibachii Nc14]|eukprot:CCA27925.1 AlNc14C834G12562 [Albugo laibachii Nc14]